MPSIGATPPESAPPNSPWYSTLSTRDWLGGGGVRVGLGRVRGRVALGAGEEGDGDRDCRGDAGRSDEEGQAVAVGERGGLGSAGGEMGCRAAGREGGDDGEAEGSA